MNENLIQNGLSQKEIYWPISMEKTPTTQSNRSIASSTAWCRDSRDIDRSHFHLLFWLPSCELYFQTISLLVWTRWLLQLHQSQREGTRRRLCLKKNAENPVNPRTIITEIGHRSKKPHSHLTSQAENKMHGVPSFSFTCELNGTHSSSKTSLTLAGFIKCTKWDIY